MHLLGSDHVFPPAESATVEGIVAVGGDLNPKRILEDGKIK